MFLPLTDENRFPNQDPPLLPAENGLVKAFTGATLPDTAAADGSGFESTSTSVATDAKAASTDAASPVSAPADALDEDEGFDGGFGGYGGRGYMTVADAMAEFGAGFVTSAGRCFPADSRVLTPSGPRRLGDLKHGDLVTNHAGRPEKVLAVAHAAANGGNLRGNRHKKGVRAGAAMMITLETAIGAITLHADHPVQDGSGRMLVSDKKCRGLPPFGGSLSYFLPCFFSAFRFRPAFVLFAVGLQVSCFVLLSFPLFPPSFRLLSLLL
ncbi:unnamed protein product [Phaeothamnion confervicola]